MTRVRHYAWIAVVIGLVFITITVMKGIQRQR